VVKKGQKMAENDSFRHFLPENQIKTLGGGSNKWIWRVFFRKIGKVTPYN